jgi:hypothetical protein
VSKPSAALVLALLADSPHGLTQLEVLDLGAGDSLAQRVHELRAEGHDIRGEYERTPRGARVVRYRLVQPQPVYRGRQEALAL